MKLLKIAALALALMFLAQARASAQQTVPADNAEAERLARVAYAGAPHSAFSDLRAVGVGLIIMGAAIGIGWLARASVESMARQPEVAGNIQTAMIIAAALIEGVTFFALIIVMLFTSPY
jgi:F-type H+-transporting ATPase subunit c